MIDNVKLIHLGKQKQALNEYVDDILSSNKYALDYDGMWRWIRALQQRLEQGEYMDVPKDVFHAVLMYNSLIGRVKAYCVNRCRDYDETMDGIELFAQQAANLA